VPIHPAGKAFVSGACRTMQPVLLAAGSIQLNALSCMCIFCKRPVVSLISLVNFRLRGTHTHTLAHTHACTHARRHTHTHARTHARTHTQKNTHTNTQIHTHTYTHMHTHAQKTRSTEAGDCPTLVSACISRWKCQLQE